MGKLTPAHSAGAHTARGLCVAPGRCVGAELTAAGPPTAQGYPWVVGGPAAVSSALTHRPGATHSSRAVGAPAQCAGVNFPTGINLAQCSPPHMAETNALVTKPLV